MRLIPVFILLPAFLPAQTSVLFIGNSYTTQNDLPNTFRLLALSLGDTVEVDLSAPGGFRLEQHREYGPTLNAINARPWDVVVLQEQSQIPSVHPSNTALASCLGAARALVDLIKLNHECTLPVFYMTWGRENGDEQQCPTWPPVCTYQGMQDLLRERYLLMTEENFGRAAAVGAAWQRVRAERPDIDLYEADGSHPTPAGTYLAACVFYTTIFQSSCSGAPFTSALEPEVATALQTIASSAVLDSASTWRLFGSPGMSAHISGSDLAPPSTLTLFHPGEGQHIWTCSNGQSSTAQQPVFALEPGSYEFTHTYTDLCGFTDTWSWTQVVWHVSGVGIAEVEDRVAAIRSVTPGMLEVAAPSSPGLFTLHDISGRLLRSARITGSVSRFGCPGGALLWELRTDDGRRYQGRVYVP